jgi:hypothetical protein
VDGRGQLVPELTSGLGVAFVRFVVAVGEGVAVLDAEEIEETEETDETTGSGMTSFVEEFRAFEYEEPPPRA